MPEQDEAPRVVTAWGKDYALSDGVPLMALMRFAHKAKSGLKTSDMDGLDALYTLLRSCFEPAAWEAFQDEAIERRADGDELVDVVVATIGALSARPTRRPSDSSGGSPSTSTRSLDDSSSQVIEQYERQGRPELALVVRQAAESRRSA